MNPAISCTVAGRELTGRNLKHFRCIGRTMTKWLTFETRPFASQTVVTSCVSFCVKVNVYILLKQQDQRVSEKTYGLKNKHCFSATITVVFFPAPALCAGLDVGRQVMTGFHRRASCRRSRKICRATKDCCKLS